jgi:hypothetical protein
VARKLKTYMTSLGFFDQAIAAPSMKAALEAWGSNSNLFHQGVAKETDDPAIVEATMAKPGLVLKRPIGSNEPFRETADLPANLLEQARTGPAKSRARQQRSRKPIDEKSSRKAALAFEREQAKRENERRKQEAAEAKARERRQHAVAKAQAALERAEQDHARKAAAIDEERAAIEERAQAEDDRWQRQKKKLEIALRRARELD